MNRPTPEREKSVRATILLVDDLEDNLFVFSEILKREGYRVISATNGNEALKILESQLGDIDLVLSDVMMPGMTGFELCKQIKGNEKTCDIPVVLMTAQLMDDEHAIEGLQYGADDYISRPVTPTLLASKLQTILGRKQATDKWRHESCQTRKALEIREWHTRMLIHDLRTPLTSAMGFLSLLAMDDSLTDRHREIISRVQNAIQKESELLEDMLALTAAREKRLHLELEAFDLGEQVQETIFLEEGSASRKGIEIKKGLLEEGLIIKADRRLIGRVLTNLMDNAIKHSPMDSNITVHAFYQRPERDLPLKVKDVKRGEILCAVENKGVPIPEEVKDQIFDPFVKGDKDREKSCFFGVGLGLSFCKEIIQAHGGNIGLISPLPNRRDGTIFYFSLPAFKDYDQ